MSGTLEALASELSTLNKLLTKLEAFLSQDSAVPIPEVTETTKGKETAKATGKKVASKKTAAKRGKAKADDLSDMTVFKKKFFAVADATGVDEVMPKLRNFIKEQGYGSSDEIEVEDRADFLEKVKDHFEALAEGGEAEEDELDSL